VKAGSYGLAALLLAASARAQTAAPPKAAPTVPDPKAIAVMIDKALQLASAERAAGRLAQAELQLRSVAERFQSVRALLELAQVQSQQKNGAGSLASLRQARALAPNSEDVLSPYAEALLASSKPDAAIPVLGALTRISPRVARYQYLAGMAVLQAGDAPAAASFLQEALRLEPDHAPTLMALGRALNRRQLYSEAKPHLLRGLSLTPNSVEAVAALAEAEAGLGELKDAEEHARRAVAQAPDDPAANMAIAMVLMKQEKFTEARDALLKVAAATPSSSMVHEQLSLAYERLSDPVSAQKHRALYEQRLAEEGERVKSVHRIVGSQLAGTEP
jgi:tetratricopeptide (TPR) repeat protein